MADQSGVWITGNVDILHTFRSSKPGPSPSDGLVSSSGHSSRVGVLSICRNVFCSPRNEREKENRIWTKLSKPGEYFFFRERERKRENEVLNMRRKKKNWRKDEKYSFCIQVVLYFETVKLQKIVISFWRGKWLLEKGENNMAVLETLSDWLRNITWGWLQKQPFCLLGFLINHELWDLIRVLQRDYINRVAFSAISRYSKPAMINKLYYS